MPCVRVTQPATSDVKPFLTPEENKKLWQEIEEGIRRKARDAHMSEAEYYMRAI